MTVRGGDLVFHQWCFQALLLVWGKALISSASHTFLSICAPLVCSPLCTLLSLWCPYLCKGNKQVSNPLQNHNCSFHIQMVSIFHPISCQYDMTTVLIRQTDHQPCLSLLGETSLDPWAGCCCSKQYRRQLGLNFLPVHSVLTMKTLRVFCLTPVCALPFMGMQTQVMLLHKTVSYSAVDTVLVHLEKYTQHLARLVFLWLKTMSYILGWLLFCWSCTAVKYNACEYQIVFSLCSCEHMHVGNWQVFLP